MRKSEERGRIIVATYLLVAVAILLADRLSAPMPAAVENELIFISDTDSIDASRGANSVYRIGLDDRGLKRVIGSIPHGDGYLRISDIDCEPVSQQLLIASLRQDLNGFYHAMLDGSGLHLDKPGGGVPLSATRQIAIAPDGMSILISRRALAFAKPRFNLVAGDLFTRQYNIVKLAASTLSYHSPDWSPDGRQIVYIIEESTADARPWYALAIAAPDGSDDRIIFETELALADVAWSPNGAWLALEMNSQVYKLRSAGSGLTQLSHHPAGASSPRWSPDGKRLSFVAPSSFSGFNQIITMDADGGDIKQVANIRGEVVNGCWV